MKFWYWVSCLLLASLIGAMWMLGRKDALIAEQRAVIETEKKAVINTCMHLSEDAPLELQKACLDFLKEYHAELVKEK